MAIDKGRIVTYEHHGQKVYVWENLKGEHRDVCLCYSCDVWKPEDEKKCEIAQANYDNCVKFGTVQPVLECPAFRLSESLKGLVEVVEDVQSFEPGPDGDGLPHDWC